MADWRGGGLKGHLSSWQIYWGVEAKSPAGLGKYLWTNNAGEGKISIQGDTSLLFKGGFVGD